MTELPKFNVANGVLRFTPAAEGWNFDFTPHHDDKVWECGEPLSGASYRPGADCPRFNAFLCAAQPDAADRDFLQAYVARALLLNMGRNVLWNYGSGANGKSVFFEALGLLAGSYAAYAFAETFGDSGNQAPPDLARLDGVRLVLVDEWRAEKPLSQALSETLTGDTPLRVRHLFKDEFEFRPVFSALFASSAPPVLDAVDDESRSRFFPLPWPARVELARRLPLSEMKAEFADELPGILNWVLQGLARHPLQILVEAPRADPALTD